MEEQALKATTNETASPEKGKGRGGYRGRGRGRGRGYNQGAHYDKTNVECYHCHKLGHYQFECLEKQEEKANLAETEEEILLMACADKNLSQTNDTWYLNSGCSNHISGDKFLFSNG